VTPQTIPVILKALQTRLDGPAVCLHLTFPYFLRRSAPVSWAKALIDYECGLTASARGDDVRFEISARVPVTSVCPCSKAVSDYGAHNQRSHITIVATSAALADRTETPVWLEDLIGAAEAAASSPVFPVLKRVDSCVTRFTVTTESDESIHNHGAYARVSWPPQK
jgi:GTP cyclohydrolase I